MSYPLDIHDFLDQSNQQLTIDVRSEGEYEYGHIPHAINLPLFNNEERKIVGTTYKQQSRNEAILTGLDIVGKKMSEFIRFVQPLVKENKVFVHCWRGGMRSGSMAWLFDLLGYEVYTLKGGYKKYRHLVLDALAQNNKYVVLGGKTGSGKTEVLEKLMKKGEQIIDLEALANHKGSAFGSLGQPKQPTTEYFENLLHLEISKLDLEKRIWMEDESKMIGRVTLNDALWKNMRTAKLMVIDLPKEIRVKRLVNEYAGNNLPELEESLNNIKRKLGGDNCKEAVAALHEKDFAKVASLALRYYDKAYEKGIATKEAKEIFRFDFENDDTDTIANTLIEAANRK